MVDMNFLHCSRENQGSVGSHRRDPLRISTGIKIVVFASGFLFALTGALAQRGGRGAAAPAGNADNGKQLYTSAGCNACHGPLAKGMNGAGPLIAPPPLAAPQFLTFVRAPSGAMRPYAKEDLSDEQLGDIYAYLQSLAPSSVAGAAVAPAGNAANGKRIYVADGCYECHGYAGQGGAGPKVGPHPIAFEAFTKQLRHPRDEMPPYTEKVVSASDLADIYSFIQSLPEPPKLENVPMLNSTK